MKQLARKSGEGRRGSALFAALAVVITVTMLVTCLMQLSKTMSRQQVLSVDNKRAFYMAEAGLSEALYGLRVNKTGKVGSASIPAKFGDGFFYVESENQGSGKVKLDSVGMAGSGRFALSLMVERGEAPIGSLGIFANSGLVINRGTYIDGYNSILGTYASQHPPAGGSKIGMGGMGGAGSPPPEPPPGARVGSNVDVAITGTELKPTLVDGDVVPGPSGSVLQTGVVTISGSTTPRDEPVDLPAIEPPTGYPELGGLVTAAGSTTVLPGGQAAYTTILVPASSRLDVMGPVELLVGELTVAPGGHLHFDATNGPIKLQVTQRLWVADGAALSAVETPSKDTSLLVSASEWSDRDGDTVLDPPADLLAQGKYFGTIYAPSSPLRIVSGFEVYGGVIADVLTIDSGAMLHFDYGLTQALATTLGDPVLLSWKVVDLPKTEFTKVLVNPKEILDQNGKTAPDAYKAHDAKYLNVYYTGTDGQNHIWSGIDSDFDNGKCTTVIASYYDGDLKPMVFP